AWRDAGMVVIDVTDRAHPAIISTLDYVPPYNGGHSPGGAAHTSAPVVLAPDQHPKLIVHTDEIFDCPPGFGRIIDISSLANPQVISNYRLPFIDENYDITNNKIMRSARKQWLHKAKYATSNSCKYYNECVE